MSELATLPPAKTLEKLLIDGDLSALNAQERIEYYRSVCDSMGLNPLTKPFAYLKLNGKLVLYGLKNCAEQLRKIHGVSVSNMRAQLIDEIYLVTADFTDKTGRMDSSTGAVPVKGLTGENRANAFMKAETKCKNRGTYSIVGLGMLDETEVATIPDAEADGEKKFKRLKPAPVVNETRTMAELIPAESPVGLPQGADVDPGSESPLPPAALPALAITHAQHKALEKNIRELCDAQGHDYERTRAALKQKMARELGVEHFPELNQDQLTIVNGWLNDAWRKPR